MLSVRTALSIQAHPDRTLAAKLNADRPGIYKDPNHKPELICALEPFVGKKRYHQRYFTILCRGSWPY